MLHHRVCTKCHKPYVVNIRRRDGSIKMSYCRSCKTAWQREHRSHNRHDFLRACKDYYSANKDRWIWQQRWKKYGVTLDMFHMLVEKQGELCGICQEPMTFGNSREDVKTAVVDHDHTTGEVRGLLCSYCNRTLGTWQKAELQRPAILRYLRLAAS